MLRSHRNFEHGNAEQQKSQNVEQTPQSARPAWMACDDAATRCIDGGVHQPGLQRVVDPLPHSNEHQAQAQEQGVGIGDAFDINGQTGYCARCAKCHKDVVPVLDLEPGVRFVPHASAPSEMAIVAQGGAA